MARLVRNALQERGYKVFMDVEDLRSGPFKTSLLGQIESSNDIVVILTANSLDRSYEEGDWLRTEISHALKHNKNVIPVIARGFKWPASLPDDMAALPNLEGLEPSNDFFDASMDRLAKLLTAMPKKPKKPVLGWVIATIGIVAFLALGITIAIKWHNNNRWLTSDEYQQEFDAKISHFYPVNIEGRCNNGREEFRAVWRNLPLGTFTFESHHAMTKQEFDERSVALGRQGYSLEAYRTFRDCSNVIRYTATWLKQS